MYTHVQRRFATKKGCAFCLALNTFTYVSSTKRDSVVGVKERSEWMAKWMVKPAEALRGGRRPGGSGKPGWPSPPLLGPWDSRALCRVPGRLRRLLIPQMVFGLLPVWLAVFGLILAGVGRATFIRCFAGACGSLTCCAVRRLPEGISAPAASPVVQFPWSCAVQSG